MIELRRSPVAGVARPFIQTSGVVRKEVAEVARQPRMLLVLVIAPFLVLTLFAVGYDQEQVVLRTEFVGPPGGLYESRLEQYTSRLRRYIKPVGYTADREGAIARLEDGSTDLVVVFPHDPVQSVLANEQAVIEVVHDKLDPIQQTAVEVAAQVAVSELNATVLQRGVEEAQRALEVAADEAGRWTGLATEVTDALADVDPATAAEVRAALERAQGDGQRVLDQDPATIIRPFRSEATSIVPQPVTVTAFFAPGAVALLLQHMVLTLASMSVVSDKSVGLFEVLRAGPTGAGRVLIGKYLAHLLVGAVVATGLLAAITALDVPFVGSLLWGAVGLFGLVSASIGLGLLLSLVARTATQAVQYAMLVLLAGLFFGGFLLELDAFRYPVKALSWALPVTYGVRLLRDVMLRGAAPLPADLIGLAATTIVYGLLAWVLLARRLRVS